MLNNQRAKLGLDLSSVNDNSNLNLKASESRREELTNDMSISQIKRKIRKIKKERSWSRLALNQIIPLGSSEYIEEL